MSRSGFAELAIAACLAVLAALVPLVFNSYWLSISVTAMMYIALCTSWVMFSGPTHYISLASGAFFGVGGYLVATGMSDYEMNFWLMAVISALVATVLAGLIGAATLRLSGVYFVIFTLGLAEMIRKALVAPKRRIATRPTLGSKKRRLDAKTKRGQVKALRGRVQED